MNTTRLALLATLALAAGSASAGSFTEGDVYLQTNAWPGLPSVVARIDPVTGATTVIYDVDEPSFHGLMTYDPYRDRLVIMPDPTPNTFKFVAVDGSYTELPNPWGTDIATFAPTGDGRIYLAGGAGSWGYIDANDQGHALYDADGVTPYNFAHFGRDHLIYDVGTNCLFLVYWNAIGTTELAKIQLSADGTRVTAPVQIVDYDAFPGVADEPETISAGPNGSLFIKIRVASNSPALLMFTVDPVTLQFTPFATIEHFFSAWNTVGTYNSTYGIAFALDNTSSHIRTYVQGGGIQAGTIISSGVSTGAGSRAMLVSIGDSINGTLSPCGDADGDSMVDIDDLLAVLAAWGNAGGPEDVDGSGTVDVGDLLIVLGTWGGCP